MTNKMTTEEKIAVMKAYTEGKQIQFYESTTNIWVDINHEPLWEWNNCEYRIKPESNYRPYKDLEEFKKDIVRKYDGSNFEQIIENNGHNYYNILRELMNTMDNKELIQYYNRVIQYLKSIGRIK